MRQAPSAGGIKAPAPAIAKGAPTPRAPRDDEESDAKTIAIVPGANPLKDLLAKRGAPGARPAGPSASMPAAKAAAAPSGSMGAAKPAPSVRQAVSAPVADPAVSKRPTVRKIADEQEISFDDAGSIDIADGMEDAEAALEAMQNFRLAEAALQRNDVAGSETLAQKAVEGDPTQADYITLLAWVKALGDDPNKVKEAVATMSKVLIEDPSNERALLYRGKLLVRTNRLHDALNDFNELLATNPHHREAASELRLLKTRMGAT
jgi:Flp pilus assembly protein TadD